MNVQFHFARRDFNEVKYTCYTCLLQIVTVYATSQMAKKKKPNRYMCSNEKKKREKKL